jgi:hypothetical protein
VVSGVGLGLRLHHVLYFSHPFFFFFFFFCTFFFYFCCTFLLPAVIGSLPFWNILSRSHHLFHFL